MMNRNPSLSNFSLYLLWVAANLIGWSTVGVFEAGFLLLSQNSAYSGPERVESAILAAVLGWVIGGVILAIAQWMIIRTKIYSAVWWLFATLIGWILGGAIMAIVKGLPGIAIMIKIIALSFNGFIIGLVQWIVLRKKVKDAGLWILANIIGWGISIFPADLFSYLGYMALNKVGGYWINHIFVGSSWVIGDALGFIATGIFTGIITGLILLWFFRSKSHQTIPTLLQNPS